MGLLSGAPRSADVTALDYSQFLTLDAADFRGFVGRHPELRAKIDEVAIEREEMNRQAVRAAPPGAG
jgi:CPA2 family monovalent cation:H+ antiporter-2